MQNQSTNDGVALLNTKHPCKPMSLWEKLKIRFISPKLSPNCLETIEIELPDE